MSNVFQQAETQLKRHVRDVISPEALLAKNPELTKQYLSVIEATSKSDKFKNYLTLMAYDSLQDAVTHVMQSTAWKKKMKAEAIKLVGGLPDDNK